MECMTCGGDVSGFHHEVQLTMICESCVSSEKLVTKTEALALGAKEKDLAYIECLYKRNPHYRSGPHMRLYVREEVTVFADRNNEKRRASQEKSDKAKGTNEIKRILVEKARVECYNKRLRMIHGAVPTPGLVSGDFCSTKTKTPKIGASNLTKRKALWNRCLDERLPVAVQVFNWATSNKKLDVSVPDALEGIDRDKNLFDRVATTEGHLILGFLDETERIVLLRTNPVFEESRHGLPIANITSDTLILCEKLGDLMNIPFQRVVNKMEESRYRWFYRYMHLMTPKRLSFILEPHFLRPSKKKEMLLERMKESFLRWGLSLSDDTVRFVHESYFQNDIVDVEYFSMSCYLSKHDVYKITGTKVITQRVMEHPEKSWIDVTKAYVEEELLARKSRNREKLERFSMRREDKHRVKSTQVDCWCGNLAAIMCVNSQCGDCCEGPCERHSGQ